MCHLIFTACLKYLNVSYVVKYVINFFLKTQHYPWLIRLCQSGLHRVLSHQQECSLSPSAPRTLELNSSNFKGCILSRRQHNDIHLSRSDIQEDLGGLWQIYQAFSPTCFRHQHTDAYLHKENLFRPDYQRNLVLQRPKRARMWPIGSPQASSEGLLDATAGNAEWAWDRKGAPQCEARIGPLLQHCNEAVTFFVVFLA